MYYSTCTRLPNPTSNNSSNCIAIVCNGEMEYTQNIKDRITSCARVIGVDGGINHCYNMNTNPHYVVGDFDSVDPVIFEEVTKNLEVEKLTRAKDQTDLEAALDKAKTISEQAQLIIFGGLGGRVDHTLGNIYLLLREPTKVFLESEHQLVFGISNKTLPVEIDATKYKTLSLLPLYKDASEIFFSEGKGPMFESHFREHQPFLHVLRETTRITLGQGEAIAVLDKRDLSNLSLDSLDIDFSLQTSLIRIFQTIVLNQTLNTNNQTISCIDPSLGRVTFPSQVGQTISLIPLFGPAVGIKTKGLKWELGPSTISELSKNFVGISNVSMDEEFSVQVEEGHLLCVINKDLIDQEMVLTEIPQKN